MASSCNGDNGPKLYNLTPEVRDLVPCNGGNNNNGLDLSKLTLEEMRDLVPAIDEKAFEYIQKMVSIETDDPILVLNYVNVRDPMQHNQFQWTWDDQLKQRVAAEMTAQGVGGRQVSASPTCFKFDTPEQLGQAKQRVKNAIPWAFNYTQIGAQNINAAIQQLNPGLQFLPVAASDPKIRTDEIFFYCETTGRQKIERDTKFFQD